MNNTIQVACTIKYHHLDNFVLSHGDIKATTNDLWPYCLVLQGRLYPDFSSLSPASFGFWYPKI